MIPATSVRFRTMLAKVRVWFQSLNTKLFIAMAILTSILTIAVAISVIGVFKSSIESNIRGLALRAMRGVIRDINQFDPELKFRREISEILATWTNPDNVYQIDIFTAAKVDGEDYVEVWATSKGRPESVIKNDAEIIKMMESAERNVELITLNSGQTVWRVYMPIQSSTGRNAKVILRVYCNLKQWDAIWNQTLTYTLKMLPIALLIEFTLLWALTSIFVRRPMHKIMKVMKLLGEGDMSARSGLTNEDELGQIARHFDAMAAALQEVSQEREALLNEIKDFNTTLQKRIEAALSELQAKNKERELLMERISILREDLSQQERLAVAGQLTAAFAHEVGTPLNLVNSHLQLLIGDPTIDDRIRDRIVTIHAQIGRVSEIVRKLLGLTRTPKLNREFLSLAPLLEELQRLWAPTLATNKVKFQAQIPDDCSLRADRKQLEQLFINLVNNAVDAMPSGGSIKLEVTQNPTSGWEFALSDTGVGIPAEFIGKVLKPMFTTKPEGKGTGLGLSICREIVRSHGGEISVESVEGQGTTIRFTMPRNLN